MATMRAITTRALRMLAVVDPGEAPQATDAESALEVAQAIIGELGGWWTDVEVTGNYTAGENERIRVNSDNAVTVTIPSTVAVDQLDRCGCAVLACEVAARAPLDGARVQVTDTNGNAPVTYYYCADAALWRSAAGLTLNSDAPLNADLASALAACVALRLAPEYGVAPSPVLVSMADEGERRLTARFAKRLVVRLDPGLQARRQW